jgi:hypothetical protein
MNTHMYSNMCPFYWFQANRPLKFLLLDLSTPPPSPLSMACLGLIPSEHVPYVPQYKFSHVFGRQDFGSFWHAFCFLYCNKKYAVIFQASKHLTMMSHVDHDNIIFRWLRSFFWTWLDMILENFVLYQNVKSGPRKIEFQVVSACFSKLANFKSDHNQRWTNEQWASLVWAHFQDVLSQFLTIIKN